MGIFVLWHWLLKSAAIALLQPWLATITALVSLYESQQWIKAGITIVLGLLLGSSTHLIWDGITHPDGFIAERIFWLQVSINISHFGDVSLARLLQYASSMMGLVYLSWFIKTQAKQVAWQNVAYANIPIIVLKSWVSLLIITIVCTGSLFCAVQAMLKWHSLMFYNTYLFLAKVLVGLLQDAIGLFIVYTFIYQILYWYCHAKSHYLNK